MNILDNIMNEDCCVNLTICGSYRFRELKEKYQAYYTIKNNLVFMPINYIAIKNESETTNSVFEKNAEIMRNIHNKKIDLSDAIIIVSGDKINYDFYIGGDTHREKLYAIKTNKPVLFTSLQEVDDKDKFYFNNDENYPLYILKEDYK